MTKNTLPCCQEKTDPAMPNSDDTLRRLRNGCIPIEEDDDAEEEEDLVGGLAE